MELVRRFLNCAGLSEPGCRSFLCQVLLGALLTLLFWLVDAVVDYVLFGGYPLSHFLLEPDPHELADFTLVLFLVCCLLLYSRRSHRVQARLEAALKDALDKEANERAKLEAIMDAMGDAISIQDRDLVVVYQNRAHQEMVGGSHAGRHCYEAYRQQGDVCPGCHLVHSFEDGKVHRVELPPPRTIGGRFLEVTSSVVPGADGASPLGIEIIRDVTARMVAEREAEALNVTLTRQTLELQQVNRELEAFCLAVSHDLRAPLTRIYSSAQELQGYREVLDENGRFFVNLVTDGCVQMEAMIDALMVLCRVTEMELVSTRVDLTPLVCEIFYQLQQSEPERKARLEAAPQVVAQGDPQLLRVALENLVSNAWKYTRGVEEAVIELGSYLSVEGEVVVYVRDNGAGFESTRTDELFKPFKRLHTAREFPGTGLGLATVRRIVRRLNGRVWGEGKIGCGATFYFTTGG